MDALAEYNELLYDLDATTCGAVSPYFDSASVSTDAGSGADSYVVDDATVPHYYIYTDISDLVFRVRPGNPGGFLNPAITDFEIWYAGTQIGERTPADQQLRHLGARLPGDQ